MEQLQLIIHLYAEGMPSWDISQIVGFDVEEILDSITPYL